jgi:hypothetical protein
MDRSTPFPTRHSSELSQGNGAQSNAARRTMTAKWLAKGAKVNKLPVFQSAIKGLENAMASALSSSSSTDYGLSLGNFLLIKSCDSEPNGKIEYLFG